MLDLLTPENLIALVTLTSLEIVLGIDNIVFVAILTSRLPAAQRSKGRNLGLMLAMFGRLALLFAITWIMGLTAPWFTLAGRDFSGRDLILILGGLFLLGKATMEIHHRVEGQEEDLGAKGKAATFGAVMLQVLLLDLVFSLDSVITAVGMARSRTVMMLAVIIAVVIMMLTARQVSSFIERHPTVKMLALSFLLLVGVVLVAEGLGRHIEKGYVYFAMAFSLFVEMLNLRAKKKEQAGRKRTDGMVT